MTRRNFQAVVLELVLLLGPVGTAAAQGPGEGGASDGSEGIFIDGLFCLGLPLFLFGGLFFWIRFISQRAKRAASARARGREAGKGS